LLTLFGYPFKQGQVLAMKNDWQSLNSKKLPLRHEEREVYFFVFFVP